MPVAERLASDPSRRFERRFEGRPRQVACTAADISDTVLDNQG
jgi:hypothetical protein